MKNKTIFCLIQDENINDFVFFKVFIPGPKGNGWDNTYAVDDFIFTYISGNKELLATIKSPFGRGGSCYNGECTSLKNFIEKDFYYLSRWNAWDFYHSDWSEIRKHSKKYVYSHRSGGYPTYPKQGKIYEVFCTEEYFNDDNISNHEKDMKELLEDFKCRILLQDEMKAFI